MNDQITDFMLSKNKIKKSQYKIQMRLPDKILPECVVYMKKVNTSVAFCVASTKNCPLCLIEFLLQNLPCTFLHMYARKNIDR